MGCNNLRSLKEIQLSKTRVTVQLIRVNGRITSSLTLEVASSDVSFLLDSYPGWTINVEPDDHLPER